jgi:NAD(P)-dependent dehydrogenase (short-subunit alcohol dehydrogenase family)
VKFTAAQVGAFFAASRDANPLHRDAQYSHRTQFGRPVVYGMAAVLYALGHWSGGRPFKLKSLKAEFRKPLLLDENYDLTDKSTAGGRRIRFAKGPVDYAVISFAADLVNSPRASDFVRAASAFVPRDAAADEPQTSARDVHYSVAPDALPELQKAFGVGPDNMPVNQLTALLWASYHVGMEMPGRQALFSELKMEFAVAGDDGDELEIALGSASFDERFNRYTVTGTGNIAGSGTGNGTRIASFSITAYKRPLPVDFTLQDLPRFDGPEPPLHSKIVFISGAARGFGAALARSCFLAGAKLALNYRGDPHLALALRNEIRLAGGEAEIFEGRADDENSMRQLAQAVGAVFGGLDLVVNNAAPPIRELQFLEQDNADVLSFCSQNLAITLETARHLLPLLREGGQFLQISTRYLAVPVRGFAHYLAAKGAQEGLIRGLAEEFPKTEFIVARLPRILTDQTNVPFSFDPAANPGKVAHELILAMKNRGPDNFRLLEMY